VGWAAEAEQVDVNAKVILLQKIGPRLPRPHADLVHSSRHRNLENFGYNIRGGRIECFSLLTPAAARFC
jgi:hypothetical protein